MKATPPLAALAVLGAALGALALAAGPSDAQRARPRPSPPPESVSLSPHGILQRAQLGLATPTRLRGEVRFDAAGTFSPATRAWLPLLTDAAGTYPLWGTVSSALRWAPELCMQPPDPLALSSVRTESGHGSKLYHLYASAYDAYVSTLRTATAERDTAPVGLVLVKESFAAVPVSAEQDAGLTPEQGAERDGQRYARGEFRGLFVMARLADNAPDTDHGWLYATVAASGVVTAAGRVEQCMGCHERAPHGRLFGVPGVGVHPR